MAKRVEIELVDDLDGTPAAETVMFGLDGAGFEIDLSENNAAALRASLATFVENARRVSTSNGRPRRRRSPKSSA